MEKRAPFVRPNSGISGEHHIQRSDDHHYLRKRTFKSVGTPRSLLLDPSGGVGGEGSGDLGKRRDLSSSANNISKIVKKSGGYKPSSPQDGESGGHGEGGYGDDLKKRRSTKSDTFR
ncbi:hypothetical protein KI688_001880 [Linnemannia hyalina]|uniref:Uncharacterized protein n=1 Tax=Linnemannia hyalina TaxID=64524 RepID=A0A9P8BS30_9FUNG|nr:hypothetical protein KI688_001880 [Linnemannia hyalina]